MIYNHHNSCSSCKLIRPLSCISISQRNNSFRMIWRKVLTSLILYEPDLYFCLCSIVIKSLEWKPPWKYLCTGSRGHHVTTMYVFLRSKYNCCGVTIWLLEERKKNLKKFKIIESMGGTAWMLYSFLLMCSFSQWATK